MTHTTLPPGKEKLFSLEEGIEAYQIVLKCVGKFADNQMEDSGLVKIVDNNNQEVEPPFRRAQSGSVWCKGQDTPSDISNHLAIARHNISQTISSGYKRSGVT